MAHVHLHTARAADKNSVIHYVASTTFSIDKGYSDLKAIGKGSYGVVCAAFSERLNKKVAIKKVTPIAKHTMDAKHVLREVRLMRHMGKHENIVTLEDLMLRELNDEIYLVMELLDSDLHRIIQSKQALTENHYRHFFYQLLSGVKYLHDNNIIHRDLKPGNLLVTKDCKLRITDFGLARERPANRQSAQNEVDEIEQAMTEHVVTRWYRPPELMLCPDGLYSFSVDIWSCGCILAEMLGRNPIFPGKNFVDQLTLIFDVIGAPADGDVRHIVNAEAKKFLQQQRQKRKVPFSSVYPTAHPDSWELLHQMLVFNPHQRVTVSDALRASYLRGVSAPASNIYPTTSPQFNFSFEKSEMSKNQLKKLIREEVDSFRKEIRGFSGSRSENNARSNSNATKENTTRGIASTTSSGNISSSNQNSGSAVGENKNNEQQRSEYLRQRAEARARRMSYGPSQQHRDDDDDLSRVTGATGVSGRSNDASTVKNQGHIPTVKRRSHSLNRRGYGSDVPDPIAESKQHSYARPTRSTLGRATSSSRLPAADPYADVKYDEKDSDRRHSLNDHKKDHSNHNSNKNINQRINPGYRILEMKPKTDSNNEESKTLEYKHSESSLEQRHNYDHQQVEASNTGSVIKSHRYSSRIVNDNSNNGLDSDDAEDLNQIRRIMRKYENLYNGSSATEGPSTATTAKDTTSVRKKQTILANDDDYGAHDYSSSQIKIQDGVRNMEAKFANNLDDNNYYRSRRASRVQDESKFNDSDTPQPPGSTSKPSHSNVLRATAEAKRDPPSSPIRMTSQLKRLVEEKDSRQQYDAVINDDFSNIVPPVSPGRVAQRNVRDALLAANRVLGISESNQGSDDGLKDATDRDKRNVRPIDSGRRNPLSPTSPNGTRKTLTQTYMSPTRLPQRSSDCIDRRDPNQGQQEHTTPIPLNAELPASEKQSRIPIRNARDAVAGIPVAGNTKSLAARGGARESNVRPAAAPQQQADIGASAAHGGVPRKRKVTVPMSPKFSVMSWQRKGGERHGASGVHLDTSKKRSISAPRMRR